MSDLAVRIEEEEERSKAVGWSDLHPDLLAEIFRRLDVVDYLRCRAVCASWRSIPEKTMNFCKPKRDDQLPWLLINSLRDETGSRRFYAPSRFHTKMAKYTMHLPQIAHHRCIGSSHGFLITGDRSSKFCALNPLTGARFPLPPTPTHPDILLYDDSRPNAPPLVITPDNYKVKPGYRKAVISPSLDAIAVYMQGTANVGGRYPFFCCLAFARVRDDSWTTLMPPCSWRHMNAVDDFIFHRGRIYVRYLDGSLLVFDLENPAAPPLVSPRMLKLASRGFMTETPDGEDILLFTRCSPRMLVFRLDQTTLEWNQVQSVGDVALFFDGAYISCLSTRKFSCLKSNCVYFVDYIRWFTETVDHIGVYDLGVYDLGNGSIHPLRPDDTLGEFLTQPVWFTPALYPDSAIF